MLQLEITNKENFLMDMQAYLMAGGKVYGEREVESRTQYEALEIINNKERLINVDVLEDELHYYGLNLEEDFDWN